MASTGARLYNAGVMITQAADRVTLSAFRARLERARLLALSDPGAALAVYYALHHDPGRTRLWLYTGADGQITGLLAVCQTGFDLFRPTVVLRAADIEMAVALLGAALRAGRPYYIVTTPTLAPAVGAALHLEQEALHWIYGFDPRRYQPEINVLVQPARTPDGSLKFVIRSQGQVAAEAGVNWRSPFFAELFVRTEPWARGRGWGRAVVAACAATLAQAGVQPLYTVAEENQAGRQLAESAGFVDTSAREFAGAGVCTLSYTE